MITGFNQTGFTVADMDKSVRFWTEKLDFKAASVSRRKGDWQGEVTGITGASLMVAHLYGQGHHVEFIQYVKGEDEGAAPQPAQDTAAHSAWKWTSSRRKPGSRRWLPVRQARERSPM